MKSVGGHRKMATTKPECAVNLLHFSKASILSAIPMIPVTVAVVPSAIVGLERISATVRPVLII